MRTVSTKEELVKAINNGETVRVVGEIGDKLRSKYRRKKVAKIGGVAMAVGSAIAIPFTAGASAAGVFMGLTATVAGLTISMTTAELALVLGAGIAIYGIHQKCKVKFESDGSVIVEPQNK